MVLLVVMALLISAKAKAGSDNVTYHVVQRVDDETILVRDTDDYYFDRIKQKAEQLHKRIPLIAMAGWDFALDENNEPVFIEANLRRPDTWPWQMTQGPIFGNRLQEVLDYK